MRNLLFAGLFAFGLGLGYAGEHPGKTLAEHPGKTLSEHPGSGLSEHPGVSTTEHPGKPMLSADEVVSGIYAHIGEVVAKNNGFFPLYDDKERKQLKLQLKRVHTDRVSYIKKEDAYFACTDFVNQDGVIYDIDFWMKKSGRNLVVYQTKIHKKDGLPRFTYQDDEIVEVGNMPQGKGMHHKEAGSFPEPMAPEAGSF